MLRNIGGYDFVYATVAALPLTCLGIQRSGGWRRAAFCALLAAQAVMVALSQYTYAMLFAAGILVVEGLALVVRSASRGRVGLGASLLWGALPLAAAFLLRMPLTALAANMCEGLGLSNFAFSFRQLLLALEGRRHQRRFPTWILSDGAGRLRALADYGQYVWRRKTAQPAQRHPGRAERHGRAGHGADGRHGMADGTRGLARSEKKVPPGHI